MPRARARSFFTSVARCAKAAHLSVFPRRPRKIEMREGVRFAAVRLEPVVPEQDLADQVRGAVRSRADARD